VSKMDEECIQHTSSKNIYKDIIKIYILEIKKNLNKK